jgi:hypothetical protein
MVYSNHDSGDNSYIDHVTNGLYSIYFNHNASTKAFYNRRFIETDFFKSSIKVF